MESFSESKNLARLKEGFKGGPFFKRAPVRSHTIVEGHPDSVMQKLKHQSVKAGVPMDVWNQRRSRS